MFRWEQIGMFAKSGKKVFSDRPYKLKALKGNDSSQTAIVLYPDSDLHKEDMSFSTVRIPMRSTSAEKIAHIRKSLLAAFRPHEVSPARQARLLRAALEGYDSAASDQIDSFLVQVRGCSLRVHYVDLGQLDNDSISSKQVRQKYDRMVTTLVSLPGEWLYAHSVDYDVSRMKRIFGPICVIAEDQVHIRDADARHLFGQSIEQVVDGLASMMESIDIASVFDGIADAPKKHWRCLASAKIPEETRDPVHVTPDFAYAAGRDKSGCRCCAFCGVWLSQQLHCPVCKAPYCGRACQKRHWKAGHKEVCGQGEVN